MLRRLMRDGATPFTRLGAGMFGAPRGLLRPSPVGETMALLFDDATEIPVPDTDEGKASQILRNFISNAIRFTEHGKVPVSATTDPDADTVSFHVRDTGVGIAPVDLEIIFQELASQLQGRVEGTGLGLPPGRRLAKLLGSDISVDSPLGAGSTFSVTLPRVYQAPQEADAIDRTWQIEPTKVPVRVLEHDPVDAFVVERVLAGSTYQPLFARSMREAEHALRRFRPAVILLDVMLGDEAALPRWTCCTRKNASTCRSATWRCQVA